MHKNESCAYCAKGELVDAFGIEVATLPTSTVYLFREQSHPGRVIVAHNEHISEIVNLSDKDRDQYLAEVNQVAKAVHKVFSPDKLNYGAYGDTGGHLHFHLVPKYAGEFEWGGIFAMNPNLQILDDAEYAQMVSALRTALQ